MGIADIGTGLPTRRKEYTLNNKDYTNAAPESRAEKLAEALELLVQLDDEQLAAVLAKIGITQ